MGKTNHRSLKWLERRLADAGYRVKRVPPMHNTYMLGPLTIKGSPMKVIPRASEKASEHFFPGEGKAFALVIDSAGEPNQRRTQVVMDLSSFTQLVLWALASDPGMFMREHRYRKDSDG